MSTSLDDNETSPNRPLEAWPRGAMAAIGLLCVAAALALTAPSTSTPLRWIGVALVLPGVVTLLLGAREREWRLVAPGTLCAVGGTLLLVDAVQFIAWVTGGLAAAILLGGLYLASRAVRKLGWVAGVVVSGLGAAAAWLFSEYQFLLLPLMIGGVIAFGVAVAIAGLSQPDHPDRKSTVVGTLRLGMRKIADHRATSTTTPDVHEKVFFDGPDRRRRFTRFLILMAFASTIASLGVVADSTAVVIGAMLVAPLMSPLMGMSFAIVTGQADSLQGAATVAVAGIGLAIAVGFGVSAFVGQGIDIETNTQIVTRASPTLIDLFIAIAAGAVGAYAISRSDVADALPGVAVSIALVPPLAVVGVAAQLGATHESLGALVLFGANAMAILMVGSLTFYLTGAAAALAPDKELQLGWWAIAFGGASLALLASLVINTSNMSRLDDSDIATTTVDEWIGSRSYATETVTVEGDTISISLTGPDIPDDTADLAESLEEDLGLDQVTVELTVALVEQLTIESGTGE